MKVILKNVFSNWVGFFIHTLIAFYLSPFLIHSLGKEVYGLWVLVGSMTGYMGMLDMGVRSAIVKFTSSYFAKKDFKGLSNIANNAITLFSFFAVVIFLLVAVLYFFFDDIFNVKPELLLTSKMVFLIVGINLGLVFPLNVFGGMISGLQRYDIVNGLSVSIAIIKLILLVIFINMGYGIVALALITVALDQLKHLIFLIIVKKLVPECVFRIFDYDKDFVRKILKFSLITFVLGMSELAIYYSDSLIIATFLSLTSVTFYTVAWTLLYYLRKIIKKTAFVLNPAASEMGALGEKQKLKLLYGHSTRFSLLLMIPIMAVLVVFGDIFLELWVGKEFTRSYIILLILSIGEVFALLQSGANQMFMGLGKHRIIAKYKFILAAVKIVLSIILLHFYGLIGVAIGTAIPTVIMHAFVIIPLSRKEFGYSLKAFFSKIIKIPMLYATVSLILLLSVDNLLTVDSWFLFISIVAVFSAIYAFCLFFVLPEKIKNTVLLKLNMKPQIAKTKI